jgi:type II secretory pathway pseudopilin PulG
VPAQAELVGQIQRTGTSEVRLVDLTQPLSERTPVLILPEPFANTPGLTREPLSRYDDRGPAWAWDTPPSASTPAPTSTPQSTGSPAATAKTSPASP